MTWSLSTDELQPQQRSMKLMSSFSASAGAASTVSRKSSAVDWSAVLGLKIASKRDNQRTTAPRYRGRILKSALSSLIFASFAILAPSCSGSLPPSPFARAFRLRVVAAAPPRALRLFPRVAALGATYSGSSCSSSSRWSDSLPVSSPSPRLRFPESAGCTRQWIAIDCGTGGKCEPFGGWAVDFRARVERLGVFGVSSVSLIVAEKVAKQNGWRRSGPTFYGGVSMPCSLRFQRAKETV